MSQNGQILFKSFQLMLQDFQSVFGHFGTLYVKGLKIVITVYIKQKLNQPDYQIYFNFLELVLKVFQWKT